MMNPYVKVFLVIAGSVLGAFGLALASAAEPVNWHSVWAAMATAGGSATLGVFTNMPRTEWSDEKRAAKTGETDEKS